MECDSPLSIKLDPPRNDGKGGWIFYFPAGCGKCLPCLMKRKRAWSYRISEEARKSFSGYFVTLTYTDKWLPGSDEQVKKDHKFFIKWLKYFEKDKSLLRRKEVSVEELRRKKDGVVEVGGLKYFAVIEHGDLSGRVHLHYILLNVKDVDSIRKAWTDVQKISKGVYQEGEAIGIAHIDESNNNTIDYVLKYMLKDRIDGKRERDYSFMSKGLGANVLDKEIIGYIRSPEGNVLLNSRGNKVGLPRYYAKKLLNDDERRLKLVHIKNEVEKEKELKEKRSNGSYFKDEVEAKEARLISLKRVSKRNVE